jgi:hypothetical protein
LREILAHYESVWVSDITNDPGRGDVICVHRDLVPQNPTLFNKEAISSIYKGKRQPRTMPKDDGTGSLHSTWHEDVYSRKGPVRIFKPNHGRLGMPSA